MVADLRPTQSLATLNLDEGQVLSAWCFARQMPRPGVRARLLKRLRENIDSHGWPVPGRRIVSVPPEISLDAAKCFFLEHLCAEADQFLTLAMAFGEHHILPVPSEPMQMNAGP